MPVRQMTLIALMCALTCIVGPLTLPVGPVPLSLTTALLMLSALLLGTRRACLSCGIYLLLGLIGLPVLSGFTGGVGCLLGPTGGYLMGYLPLTALCGFVSARTTLRRWRLLAMVTGTAALYALGTGWYCLQAQVMPSAAIATCVLPFLPFDALKIAAVLLTGPTMQRRLTAAGLLR